MDASPAEGEEFIYILSNRSLPGLLARATEIAGQSDKVWPSLLAAALMIPHAEAAAEVFKDIRCAGSYDYSRRRGRVPGIGSKNHALERQRAGA